MPLSFMNRGIFKHHMDHKLTNDTLVVSIMASPRMGGNTASLLDEAERGARAAGANVERINISDLKVHPCVACMKCRRTGECMLPHDDAHRVAELLRQANSVIVAMPVYWASMPGTLKVLLDRLVYLFIDTSAAGVLPKPLMRGRKLGVICSCTTPWPLSITQTRPAVKALRRVFRSGGFTIYPPLCLSGTRDMKVLKQSAVRAAARLGDMMV